MPPKSDTVQRLNSHNGINDPYNQAWGMVWNMKDPGAQYYTYRNIAIVMNADTSIKQNQGDNRQYEFHILNDNDTVNLYSDLYFPDNFTVANGDEHAATFNLDFNNIFFNSSNPINLRASVGTDMFGYDIPGIKLGEMINRNFYNSLRLVK